MQIKRQKYGDKGNNWNEANGYQKNETRINYFKIRTI